MAKVDGSILPVLVAVAEEETAIPKIEHECLARMWGAHIGLRVPRVLDSGRGWMASQMVDLWESEGASYVDEALTCAAMIRTAGSPPPPAVSTWQGARRDIAQRLIRAVVGRLPLREFRSARAEAAQLPMDVYVHGDFSTANVMNSSDGIWLIDWEFAGRGVWGTDEIRLWSTLEQRADRDRLLTRFVDELPAERRGDTGTLIHWLALRQLAENLTPPRRLQKPENVAQGHEVVEEARSWRAKLSKRAIN